MYRRLCVLAMLFSMGCSDDNPCSKFIIEEDIQLGEQLDSTTHPDELRTTALKVLIANGEDLGLSYSWAVAGESYTGSQLELQGTGKQEGQLTVSNAGCSITKTVLFEFDIPTGSIGGTVWEDIEDPTSEQQALDETDKRLSDVVVQLLSAADRVVLQETVSDEQGTYLFTGLRAGDYIVKFQELGTLPFVSKNASGDMNIDSDADEEGYTEIITIADWENKTNINAGYHSLRGYYIDCSQDSLGSIAGRAWKDSHYFEGGIGHAWDETDLIAPNIKVELLDGHTLEVIAETQTDLAEGRYQFENVLPGSYVVRFHKWDDVDRPFLWLNSELGFDEEIDSDVNQEGYTEMFKVWSCQQYTHVDAGFKICFEDDADCQSLDPCTYFLTEEDIIISVSTSRCNVELENNVSQQFNYLGSLQKEYLIDGEIISDVGTYNRLDFTNRLEERLVKGSLRIFNDYCSVTKEFEFEIEFDNIYGYIGNTVWLDNMVSGDFQILDPTDARVENIRVELLEAEILSLVMVDVTDINGEYLFENVLPGDYVVRFINENPQLKFVRKHEGDIPELDSDVDFDGYTDEFTLEGCEINFTIDAGLIRN